MKRNMKTLKRFLSLLTSISIVVIGSLGETDVLAARSSEIPKEITNSIGMKLMLIPAGTFMMGHNNSSGSKSAHQVTITKPFYMGVYEVTNAQYELFDPNHARDSTSPEDNTPVNWIRFSEAVAFCDWLTKKEAGTTGLVYRLPHEIEWEYAAHGGKNYPYPNTNMLLPGKSVAQALREEANYYGTEGPDRWKFGAPVGSLAPNGYGLYDMIGNVKEWCVNRYYEYPSGPVVHDPYSLSKEGQSELYVIRGNSYWTEKIDALTVHYRTWHGYEEANPKTGFRVLAVPPTVLGLKGAAIPAGIVGVAGGVVGLTSGGNSSSGSGKSSSSSPVPLLGGTKTEPRPRTRTPCK
jgi:formylglycine-generating enzyme required for sulfatase activity